jgi:hypothetical protein
MLTESVKFRGLRCYTEGTEPTSGGTSTRGFTALPKYLGERNNLVQ